MNDEEAAIYQNAIEEIANGDCTGPSPSFVCKIASIPRSRWCPKCIAEDALTQAQKAATVEEKQQ